MGYTKVGPFTDYSGSPGLSAAWANGVENELATTWTAYTPTLAGVTLGTAGSTVFGWRYEKDSVHVRGVITLGTSGYAVTGLISATLPVNADLTVAYPVGVLMFVDAGIAAYPGIVTLDTSHVTALAVNTSGAYAMQAAPSSTVPFTWGPSDYITFDFIYPHA